MTYRRMFATIRAMPPGTRVRDTGATARAAITPRDTGEVLAYRQDGTVLVAWDRPRMRHATYTKPAAAWWTHPEDLECLT